MSARAALQSAVSNPSVICATSAANPSSAAVVRRVPRDQLARVSAHRRHSSASAGRARSSSPLSA